MTLGRRFGCLTALLDMAKVAIPVLAFRLWAPDQPYYLIVAADGEEISPMHGSSARHRGPCWSR